jgi:hypothetical protein
MVVVDEIDHVASPWSRSAAEAVLTAFTDVANRPQIVFVGATSSGGSYELVQKYLGNGFVLGGYPVVSWAPTFHTHCLQAYCC